MVGANLGAVEIECQDCHGTTKKYPWELPLGYSDEFSMRAKEWKPKGDDQNLSRISKKGGYSKRYWGRFLLSARGKSHYQSHKKLWAFNIFFCASPSGGTRVLSLGTSPKVVHTRGGGKFSREKGELRFGATIEGRKPQGGGGNLRARHMLGGAPPW